MIPPLHVRTRPQSTLTVAHFRSKVNKASHEIKEYKLKVEHVLKLLSKVKVGAQFQDMMKSKLELHLHNPELGP